MKINYVLLRLNRRRFLVDTYVVNSTCHRPPSCGRSDAASVCEGLFYIQKQPNENK